MNESPAGRGMLLTPELIKDLTVAISKQDRKPEELQLKQQEIRHARHSLWVGAITAIATATAAVAAAVAVIFAGKGVNVAQMAIASQTKEARFSTAVQTLGGNQPTERVAGAIMLRHMSRIASRARRMRKISSTQSTYTSRRQLFLRPI